MWADIMQTRNNVNEFSNFHPFVNLLYFILVIGFSMFFMNPVFLLISIIAGVVYSIVLKGNRAVWFNLIVLLPTILITMLLNPAFNHNGTTILLYLPSGNPLTLESILYGVAAGTMLAAVICWFSCFNEIMTSDKFVYLFGKITPSLSLILSMTLRFVPKFKKQFLSVAASQKNIGRSIYNGKLLKRLRCAATIVSIMVTWSLENAIDTADSMKSRGYGLCKRSAFSIFKFDSRDKLALTYLIIAVVSMISAIQCGGVNFSYFPSISFNVSIAAGTVAIIAYFMLCTMPIWIELWEMNKWK